MTQRMESGFARINTGNVNNELTFHDALLTTSIFAINSKDLAIPSNDITHGGTNDIQNFARTTPTAFTKAFSFSRKLDTTDPYDIPITKTDMQVIFAYGDDTKLQYHGPTHRAHATINFYSGIASVGSDAAHGLLNLNIFHGVSMYIGFGYIYPGKCQENVTGMCYVGFVTYGSPSCV